LGRVLHHATRGHDFKLQKIRARYDLRTISLIDYLVGLTNVVSAESVNRFKNRLDNFWKDQEVIYKFHAEIYGTGNLSEVPF